MWDRNRRNMLGTVDDMPQYRKYMTQALELAHKGAGWVNPNPLVGTVVVRDGHQNSAHCASLQHAAKNVGLMAFGRIRSPLYANSLTNELYWCVYHFHNVVGGTPEAMKHQNT